MESFGGYLKKERESRSVSLEEISAATRIRKLFLEAIESDDIDKLPAEVFVKGFLRAYARYVGLDKDEVIIRYQKYMDSFKNINESKTPPPKKPFVSRLFLVISPLVVIVIVFMFFYTDLIRKEEIKTNTNIISKPLNMPPLPSKETIVQTPLVKETREEVVTGNKRSEESVPTATLADELKILPLVKGEIASQKEEERVLLVKTNETTWLRIQIDDNQPFEVTLKPGDNITWKALQTIKLLIGNAGGIDLFYNGKAVGRIGDSGQVVYLTLPNKRLR